MGKGRPRAVEKGVLGQNLSVASSGSLNIPSGPVFYPSEDEFRDPLEYIYKIRAEAEPYGICRIVPPKSWKPPFALDLDSFTFPTKTQAIHQLQARPASCDSQTFELEYNRFLEDHCGKKSKKRVVFEGEELDLCKLFNAVKRYGGYDHVVKEKKWGEVSRFVSSEKKISECAKHVLCQLYCEHLCDYEDYYKQLNKEAKKGCKRGLHDERKCGQMVEHLRSKKRQKTKDGEKGKVCKYKVKEEHDQICEQCKSGLHGEVMLLCDRCNKGWHTYCLSPPLKQVPPGNWYCLDCLNSDKDSFGFVPGKQFSLEAFRRMADRARKKWFGSGSSSREQIEKKFWEIVEGSLGEVEVMYGSDLDTSVYGSGFPHARAQKPESIDAKEWDEYRCSPWNLNNLPKLKGSVLRAVHHNITGVMVPWLYIGMLFSSFCWHFEDHCFYSMNYLHWGEPKCWYSIPGSEATAFEKVMKKSLPDLFDAQPDLLFQLVTMLNPSVLRENGVPVYSVLQEPGNFVITFPRSYHGGFNLGLNCAEAVNFAPADWIPHGGFGAELYQLYRKIAVLSHEELLCVVAKNDCDERVSPYLKKELLRIYAKEKSWRQRLWKNGIVRSSSMAPRKCPEYVGTEEDPKCIICQQYLYLSAVVCRCRRSAFVCLEHWERLCECKYSKRRLLYRHTLSELYDLVLTVNEYGCDETMQSLEMQQPISCFSEANALTRKVKDDHVTFAELSAQWLLNSSKILQNPFSNDAYVKALKEVEQFLWAGSEMDPVRDMAGKLIETKKWMVGIKDCIVKVENFQGHPGGNVEKIHLDYVINLLSLNHSPCNELTYLKLMAYTEEARLLIQEIDTALSTSSNVSEWEALHSKACALPIYIQQIEKLEQQISLVKVCKESIRVIIENGNEVEVDILYKLKSQVMELHVKLPETEMLFDLISQAESHRSKCAEIIKGPITLKIVEEFLQELSSFNVSLPELKLLRQHHMDAVSWIARFNNIMVEIHEREDQHNVIDELNCILRDGSSLAIQVDELARVEDELKKAYCREKAQKWKQHCLGIVANSVGEKNSLLGALQEIKQTVDRSLSIYDKSLDGERNLNACCSTSSLDQKLHNCSICKQGYHIGCLQLSVIDTNDADLFTCPYCQRIISSSVTQKISLLKCRGNLPKLEELIKLKCDAEDFSDCIEEGDTLTKLVEQALVCRSRLTEISDLASHNTNKDLTIVFQRLTVALKAIEVSGVSDYRSNNALERAVVRNSWRFRVNKILEGQEKPTIQQIQKLLKEGLAINISLEDCFRTKLLDMKNVSSKWADRTKKISADSGALALEKVFEYIAEGESLPVNVEKELKLLRTRSMLYCICRKPYDQRAMIACDQCDEWYHFDCIKLHSTPKTYICPACKPQTDDKSCSLPVSIKYESSINKRVVKPTTRPHQAKPRSKPIETEANLDQKMVPISDCSNALSHSSEVERLWWRNQKPFRRVSKKRAELQTLSQFFRIQQQ